MAAIHSPEDILTVLSGENREVAAGLIGLAVKYDLKPELKYTAAKDTWKCGYTLKKPRRKIFTMWAAPDKFEIKANLFNLDEYSPDFDLSEAVKNRLLHSAYDCADCEGYRCGGVRFTLDGQSYHKCVFGAFSFTDLDAADYRMLAALIEREIEAARRK